MVSRANLFLKIAIKKDKISFYTLQLWWSSNILYSGWQDRSMWGNMWAGGVHPPWHKLGFVPCGCLLGQYFTFLPHGNVFLSVQHQVSFISNMREGVTYTVFPLVYFCMSVHVWALQNDTAAALWIDKQELAFICHSRIHFLQERKEERSNFWPQVCKVPWTFLQYKHFARLPENDKFAAAERHKQNCKCTCAWKWMNWCCVSSWAQ